MSRKMWLEAVLLVIVFAFGIPFSYDVGGYHLAFVIGESMEPTIPESSFVLLQEPGEIEMGQIVVFNRQSYAKESQGGSVISSQACMDADDLFIIHRIVAQSGEDFITKGDNNQKEDSPPVRKEDIRWVYLHHSLFLPIVLLLLVAALILDSILIWRE